MTDFSRYENKSKPKRARKPIRWGKIASALVWVAIVAFPATLFYLDNEGLLGEDTFKFSFGVDVKIDSKPSKPLAPKPEPEPTGLTFEKLRDFYDENADLTELQFKTADAKFKGQKVVFFASIREISVGYDTIHVHHDHGFEWGRYGDSKDITSYPDSPENRTMLMGWHKGTQLKFECVYDEAKGILTMQPRWSSCVVEVAE